MSAGTTMLNPNPHKKQTCYIYTSGTRSNPYGISEHVTSEDTPSFLEAVRAEPVLEYVGPTRSMERRILRARLSSSRDFASLSANYVYTFVAPVNRNCIRTPLDL